MLDTNISSPRLDSRMLYAVHCHQRFSVIRRYLTKLLSLSSYGIHRVAHGANVAFISAQQTTVVASVWQLNNPRLAGFKKTYSMWFQELVIKILMFPYFSNFSLLDSESARILCGPHECHLRVCYKGITFLFSFSLYACSNVHCWLWVCSQTLNGDSVNQLSVIRSKTAPVIRLRFRTSSVMITWPSPSSPTRSELFSYQDGSRHLSQLVTLNCCVIWDKLLRIETCWDQPSKLWLSTMTIAQTNWNRIELQFLIAIEQLKEYIFGLCHIRIQTVTSIITGITEVQAFNHYRFLKEFLVVFNMSSLLKVQFNYKLVKYVCGSCHPMQCIP